MPTKDHTVYCIRNLVNDMQYVGVTTTSLARRFVQHQSKHSYIGNAIRKYGRDNFVIYAIETCKSHEEMCELETQYILLLGTMYPMGYNRDTGGIVSRRHSLETRIHLSEVVRVTRGEKNGNSKLTQEQVTEIRRLSAQGYTYLRLMGMFGLGSDKYVGQIVRGTVWS